MDSKTLSNTRIAQAISFVSKQLRDVKSFSGFQKHHRLPGGNESSRFRFVAGIAEGDIDQNLSDVFSRLRAAFGFKRKEIIVSGPIDGTGTISTPAFTYQIDLLPSDDHPDNYWWQRSVKSIVDHEMLFSPQFDRVFGTTFDTLRLELPDPLDVESIIDHIEEADVSGVSIDYDKDSTWCRIRILESMTTMRISSEVLSVTGPSEMTPEKLLQGFWQIQNRFLETLSW